MNATCKNCNKTAIIADDKIPQCGREIRWQCSNCPAWSYIYRIEGGFKIRLDEFSLMLEKMKAVTIQANVTDTETKADVLWNACLKRIFTPPT